MAVQDSEEMRYNDLKNVYTFAENGVLTYNKGLVVTIGDRQFQITIVQSA